MIWDNRFMQGFERMDREFTDAELLAGHLVPAGSMFAFLAAHRAEVFPDAGYADLFAPPGFGRPSLPPGGEELAVRVWETPVAFGGYHARC